MDHRVGSYLARTVELPFEVVPPRGHGALVIVETRPSYFLPHIVATAVRAHPGWHLYVFGTPAVHALLQEQCKNYTDSVTRITLDASPRMTTRQYSRLLLSAGVWSAVREEHVLVFQSDCVVVRPTTRKMLKYDYVGAVCGALDPASFVMNGGLSLRRRSAMLRAVELIHTKHPRLLDLPEDVALCKVMRATGTFALPPMDVCNEFAIESMGDPRTAVGMHGTDKFYAPPELVDALLGA